MTKSQYRIHQYQKEITQYVRQSNPRCNNPSQF